MLNLPIGEATNVELVPPVFTSDVSRRLAHSVARCENLRASVAFWTLPPNYVGPALASRIAMPRGFLCVDIHPPTSINQLNDLAAQGAHVRLHLRKLDGKTESAPVRDMPPYLLHTKFLLFDMPDHQAELWVGSHNWTQRALEGPNIEASLVVTIPRSAQLYEQAEDTLAFIYDLCTPFNPNDIDYYKLLQSQPIEKIVKLLDFEGGNIGTLEGTGIVIFSSIADDIRDLPTNSEIYLRGFESHRPFGAQYLYHGRVIQSGALPIANRSAAAVNFVSHRYIYRREARLPILEMPLSPDSNVLDNAEYFATVDMRLLLPDTQILEPAPSSERWIYAVDDPLLNRLPRDEQPVDQLTLFDEEITHQWRFQQLHIKVPAGKQSMIPRVSTLLEQRSQSDHKLVSRKILRTTGMAEE